MIKIGDKTYRSDANGEPVMFGGQSGFQLLLLDQGSLAPLVNETYITNEADGSQNLSGSRSLTAMASRIKSFTDAQVPVFAIVQSIGHPHVRHHEWIDDLAPALRSLGGTQNLVNALDGSHGYALVGGTRLPVFDTVHNDDLHIGKSGYGEESSDFLTPGPVRMTGVLSQNSQAQFVAGNWASDEAFDRSIYSLVYETSAEQTPWPGSSDPGQQAALAFIVRKLHAKQPFTYPADLRANYVADQDADAWNNRLGDLRAISYPQTRAPGFSPDDFSTIQGQLDDEFEYVSDLRGMIDDYELVFTSKQVSGLIDLEDIASEIENDISPPQGARTTINMKEVGAGLAKYAESAISIVPGIGELAGPAIGLFEGVGEIVGSIETSGGIPITVQIEEEERNLASELAGRYAAQQSNLDHAGDLLVSNWAALSAAGPKATTDWKLDSGAKSTISTSLRGTSSQQYYGAMVPIAYQVWDLFPEFGDDPGITRANDYQCISESSPTNKVNLFDEATSASQFPVTYGWHDSSNRRNIHPWVLAAKVDEALDGGGRVVLGRERIVDFLPKDTLTKMFAPFASGGRVGMYQVTFFEQSFPHRQLRCMQS